MTKILKKAGKTHAVIIPEKDVAMKVDLAIPWENVKCIAR